MLFSAIFVFKRKFSKHKSATFHTQDRWVKFYTVKKLIILIIILFNLQSYSQLKVNIKFKNSEVIRTIVKQIGEELISLKTGETYNLNEIDEIKIFEKNLIKHYFILDVKSYKSSKRVQKGLGQKVYSNGEIELFRINFILNLKTVDFSYIPKTFDNKYEVFIKRKNKKYTYNIGCIDGIGCEKIKKRLKDFFNDCPSLIRMIKRNKIKKRAIIKIIDYYNESCSD